MPRGQSNAQVLGVFSTMLKTIKEHAAAAAKGLRAQGQPTWFSTGTDPLDIAKAHEPLFVRDEINGKYSEAMKSSSGAGTVADVIALKRQIDYMAAAERAFRLQNATPVRLMAHAAARRQAHGQNGVFDAVAQVLGDTIRAGASNG